MLLASALRPGPESSAPVRAVLKLRNSLGPLGPILHPRPLHLVCLRHCCLSGGLSGPFPRIPHLSSGKLGDRPSPFSSQKSTSLHVLSSGRNTSLTLPLLGAAPSLFMTSPVPKVPLSSLPALPVHSFRERPVWARGSLTHPPPNLVSSRVSRKAVSAAQRPAAFFSSALPPSASSFPLPLLS